jgi:hypothetical protein
MNIMERHASMMTRIFTISLMIAAVLTTIIIIGIETFNVGHAQLLTPQEKAQFCNPNNPKLKFVNSTESKICGIPTTSTNATNATTTPSSILAPSIIKATP